MPGRKFDAGSGYRYGFNGKENDNEVKGEGNQQDYGMRIYDSRLGRFLSTDPIAKSFPQLTPYQFASNQPIESIDLDGLERLDFRALKTEDGKTKLSFLTEGPKVWQSKFGSAVNKVKIPLHYRIEYNGQHYIFADGTKHNDVYSLPLVSNYGQYSNAVHYAADYRAFLVNPDQFCKTHLSEEQAQGKTEAILNRVDEDMAKAEIVVSLLIGGLGDKIGRGTQNSKPRGSNHPDTRKALNLGNKVHYDKLNGGSGTALPTELSERYPNTQFEFIRRGQKGADVKVVGGTHPSNYPGSSWAPGKNFADFKPDTPSGNNTFNSEIKNGKLPENTQKLTYDPVKGKLQ